MDFDRKSCALFRVYQVLFDHSDVDHILTQQKIATYLKDEYQIEITRQAISRHIQSLIDMGFDVEVTDKGSYLISRPIEKYELILLIDSVLSSRHISSKYSKDLINKLIALGGPDFKNSVKHVYVANQLSKTTNQNFFYNIEIVSDAIENNKKISFDYLKYDEKGNTVISSKHVVSPYQLILHNQHYYLILRDDKRENIGFYRMDKISNIKITKKESIPLKDNPGYEKGINFENFTTGMPYLFNDEPKIIRFRCAIDLANQLFDWFEGSIQTIKEDSKHLLCTIKTSEEAMLYWALQYNKNVEIIAPESLRNRMIETLNSTLNLYK